MVCSRQIRDEYPRHKCFRSFRILKRWRLASFSTPLHYRSATFPYRLDTNTDTIPSTPHLNDASRYPADLHKLAYFGAKVIHPKTMLPAIDEKIPIFIRNTFNPEGGGSRIFETSKKTKERPVAGFSTVENVAIVNVEGTGMIGVSGITQQIFTVLNNTAVPVKMVAQCSSEVLWRAPKMTLLFLILTLTLILTLVCAALDLLCRERG